VIIAHRRSNRSAMTPPSGPTKMNGSIRAATVAAASTDEWVRSKTTTTSARL
jgi:hypothetical protein